MDIKTIMKSKKTKNILFTLLEILIVAALIFGVLMYLYNKINNDSEQIKERSGNIIDSGNGNQENSGSDDYYIEINKKKNAVIISEYSDKKHKDKKIIKVFNASVGKSLKPGKYKTKKDFNWVKNDKYWHQYNTKLSGKSRIQSVCYTNKYAYSLLRKSYNSVGKTIDGDSVRLYSADAAWIYNNCKNATVVRVVKGKKSDSFPLKPDQKIKLKKYVFWDPTDPSGNNPYLKIKPGNIVIGNNIVYVEKGSEVQYLGNMIAIDEKGNDITGNLLYKTFNDEKLGKHIVKYSYKAASGKKYEISQEFQVIDTTYPVVTCSKSLFTYRVISQAQADMNKQSNVKEIEDMVKPYVSCNEEDCDITVNTIVAGEMALGEHPVIITAKDKSGNIGSCQVTVEVKLKDEKFNKSGGLSDAEKESLKKAAKEGMKEQTEEQTEKKEKTTKKKSSKKKEENTTEDFEEEIEE